MAIYPSATQSTINKFQSVLEEAKKDAQLDAAKTPDAWFDFWESFWKKCEIEFPGLNGIQAKIVPLFKRARFDFEATKRFAANLPDNAKRIAFFLEAKTNYQQEDSDWPDAFEKSFAGKCDLEIQKYKELAKLEKEQNRQPEGRRNLITDTIVNALAPAGVSQNVGPRPWGVPDASGFMTAKERHYSEWTGDESKKGKATPDTGAQKAKTKRHLDLTIDRAILLIDALGGSRLRSADRDKLAEVIAFLTGYETESVRQRYSALNPDNATYKGNTESGIKALQDDLEKLSSYFDMIGLRGELQILSDKLGIPLRK